MNPTEIIGTIAIFGTILTELIGNFHNKHGDELFIIYM